MSMTISAKFNDDRKRFTNACIEALYFTDTGEIDQGQPPADAGLAPGTRLSLEYECRLFWEDYGWYVEAAGGSPEQAGHDFWLTRNGHGAGFWDGDWPEPYADILTKGADRFGRFETYLGDDGLIWVG